MWKCGKVFTAVAYGLAIAKVALEIQATESPKYDVFVNLVWGPHLINQSRILEKGTLKRCITGKSLNCCRKIHQILASPIEKHHFREFDSRFNNEKLSVVNDQLKLIKEVKIRKFLKGSYWSPTWISAVLKRYYGKQIWVDSMGWQMGYIEMFHPYHEFAFNHDNYPWWFVFIHKLYWN